jgi:hypothetical protein
MPRAPGSARAWLRGAGGAAAEAAEELGGGLLDGQRPGGVGVHGLGEPAGEQPVRMASAGSWIISPAHAATIVAPITRPPPALPSTRRLQAMSVTKPSVRPAVTARSASLIGRYTTRAPGRVAAACGWVSPTWATSGSVNAAHGIAAVVNAAGGDQRCRRALRAAKRPIAWAAWVNGIRPVTSPAA